MAACVDIENQGTRSGVEIAQPYVNDLYTSLSTPSRQLRSFERMPLDPAERRTVRFELGPEALAFVDADEREAVEPGEFELLVGPSSRDEDLLRARFRVLG